MEKRKQEREEKKRQVEEKKQEREKRQKGVAIKETRSQSIGEQLENLTLCDYCGKVYGDYSGLWVSCDICNKWYDFKCTNIKSRRAIPDSYICDACV